MLTSTLCKICLRLGTRQCNVPNYSYAPTDLPKSVLELGLPAYPLKDKMKESSYREIEAFQPGVEGKSSSLQLKIRKCFSLIRSSGRKDMEPAQLVLNCALLSVVVCLAAIPAHIFLLIGKTSTHKDDLYRHSDSEPLPLFRSY